VSMGANAGSVSGMLTRERVGVSRTLPQMEAHCSFEINYLRLL
jgi:hypothetical protein